ncbi:MAG: hypothetical protein JNK21_14085 [Rhodospirillaceae bacterium]|nr:hypothetical protein [Rhodospirillaceae bacterium]
MTISAADSIKVAGTSIPRNTLRGIQVASAQSGVSFQYLLAKAAQESGFKADAEAATSSATGLFQFTRGTWLDVFKRHGAEFGYGDLAGQIGNGIGGKPGVADKSIEKRILDLREDPEASAKFAAAYARDNADALNQTLNRDLDAADLYLAHFLGPTGAGQMLTAEQSAPNVYASHVAPDAARANRSIFFAQSGAPRTVAQVVNLIRERFDNQMDRFADIASTMAGEDDAKSISAGQDATTPRAPAASSNANVFDFGSALQSGNSERMSISWFVMQELARMISNQPMLMMTGEDDADGQDGNTTLSSGGFTGEDMSQVLVDNMARNNLPPSLSGAVTSGQAAKAYTQLARRGS